VRRAPALAAAVAAVMILLSAFAHSVLGWRAMGTALAQTNAPADLVRGLGIGWVFGGACMVAFGLTVAWTSRALWRGASPPRLPLAAIVACYLLFGAAAMVVSGGDPFYLVFIIPGLLAAYAAVAGSFAK
jgi:hypothetical protein